MSGANAYGTALSSLRDGAANASPPKASIAFRKRRRMMSHHGPDPFDGPAPDNIQKLLAEMKAASRSYTGPVGDYPHGKLTPQDEGSLQFAVGGKGGKVVIDFGSPVAWVGMTPQQAMDLAASVMSKARSVARENGETVYVTIGG